MVTNEDRELLFGTMARELGFISGEALDEVLRARDLSKDRSIGRIFVDRCLLGGEECALLEAMVDKHLQRHGNDPQRSLAVLKSAGRVGSKPRHAATDVTPDDFNRARDRQEFAETPTAEKLNRADEYPTLAPRTEEMVLAAGTSPERLPRFRVLRHHASGGLGRVFVAYDQELNREVALKEIHAQYADRNDCQTRFLLEAEVTGRLEHPGVVPVYGLGKHADGLPYYAMRFIQGESLKEAIQRFHATKFAQAGQRTLSLRQLLGSFIAVCQTVRYAHSRGIVHRDLKPDNIMLGKFGETLVVDWGLAKAIGSANASNDARQPDPAEDLVQIDRRDGMSVTRAGAVLGTPGYMSPEQADGLLHEVSPASDIYSLGATLYTILAGRAPLPERTIGTVYTESGKRTFPLPRMLDRRVSPALEAICVKAMALLPRDRYASAGELAEDVERWLAYEPVTAYREPLPARFARWMRRHPVRVASLAATLLVGALGLSAVLLVMWNSNRKLEAAYRGESEARSQADARFRDARVAVNEFFTEISENKELLKKQPGTQALRSRLLEKARGYYEGFLRDHGDNPAVRGEAAAAYYRLGEMTNSLSPGSAKAINQFERGVAVLEPLLHEHPVKTDAALLQAKLYRGMGMALGRADRFEEGLASFEKSRTLLKTLIAEHPPVAEFAFELARTYGGIAYVQGRARKDKEAVEANGRAAAICEELVKARPDEPEYNERLAITYLNMGSDHKDAGEYDEALKAVTRARAVAERLVAKNPGVAQYLQIVVYAYNNMGHYQTVLGQRDQALSTLTRGIAVAEQLKRDNPGVPDYASILGYMHFNRGDLQLQQADVEQAKASLSHAVGIFEPLRHDYPDTHQYANLEARALESLGWAQDASGKTDDAAASFSQCLAICDKLAKDDPKRLEPMDLYVRVLATCPVLRLRNPTKAVTLARESLNLESASSEHLAALGLALYRAGSVREADESLEKALKHLPLADPMRPSVELTLVLARWQTGRTDAARELLADITSRLDKAGLKHPEVQSLRAEAETLLKTDRK
jgi:serine/threonine-protein kinase